MASFSASDTLALAGEAVREGIISKRVLDQLISLHPQVPNSMKHRYLLQQIRMVKRHLERKKRHLERGK